MRIVLISILTVHGEDVEWEKQLSLHFEVEATPSSVVPWSQVYSHRRFLVQT
jgi:hypothetical protein